MSNTRSAVIDVYNKIAKAYSANSDESPFNTFYERPAMLNLIGSVAAKNVLEVGCGHGYYLQAFLEAGAKRVVGVDASSSMLQLASERVGDAAELHLADAESLHDPEP